MRRTLRARPALPGLVLLLPLHREHERHLLAQVASDAADACGLLRIGRTRRRHYRAARWSHRIRDRSDRRRLPALRTRRRPDRKDLPGRLRSRPEMPGLDLLASRLRLKLGGLLPEGPHHAPATAAVLPVR